MTHLSEEERSWALEKVRAEINNLNAQTAKTNVEARWYFLIAVGGTIAALTTLFKVFFA